MGKTLPSYTAFSANGKRFAALFMDNAIVAMFSMILFAAVGAPMFSYYQTAGEVETSANALTSEITKTHLLASSDSLVPSDAGETSLGQIWLVNLSADTYVPSNDILYYYHTTYLAQDVASYNQQFLSLEQASLFQATSSTEPISFVPATKKAVKSYSEGSDTGAEALSYYNSALTAFKTVYRQNYEGFAKSEKVLPLYSSYAALNEKISYEAGDAALVSYILSALSLYVGVPFLLKKGRTVAKKVLHLEVVSLSEKLIPWQVISRGLIETLEFSYLTVFAPFFFLQLPAISLPFWGSGNWVFGMGALMISSLAVSLLSGGLTLFDKEKAALQDYATLTRVVESELYEKGERKEESDGGVREDAGIS
jgi:uncharacterized RDD family membrane protein YckC